MREKQFAKKQTLPPLWSRGAVTNIHAYEVWVVSSQVLLPHLPYEAIGRVSPLWTEDRGHTFTPQAHHILYATDTCSGS